MKHCFTFKSKTCRETTKLLSKKEGSWEGGPPRPSQSPNSKARQTKSVSFNFEATQSFKQRVLRSWRESRRPSGLQCLDTRGLSLANEGFARRPLVGLCQRLVYALHHVLRRQRGTRRTHAENKDSVSTPKNSRGGGRGFYVELQTLTSPGGNEQQRALKHDLFPCEENGLSPKRSTSLTVCTVQEESFALGARRLQRRSRKFLLRKTPIRGGPPITLRSASELRASNA